MNGNKKPNKVNDDANIVSWVLTAVLLAVNAFPIGLFFLIMKLAGNDILGKLFMALQDGFRNNSTSDATRASTYRSQNYTPNSSSRSRAAQNAARQGSTVVVHDPAQTAVGQPQVQHQAAQASPQPRPVQQKPEPQRQEPQKPVQQQTQAPKKEKEDDGIQHISRGKKALFILGWILLGAGILGSIYGIAGSGVLWKILQWIAVALGGGGMLFAARSKDKKERLYQNLVKIVGDKAYVELKSLASSAGIKEKTLIRELDEMVERGYLPESAYLDNARGLLILDQTKAEDQIVTTQTAEEPGREEDKYDLLLKEMERACGRIQDRDMLEKAIQIRGLAAAIFNAVRKDPDKQPQISSFLNYYFPTTLKLLDSYADFEEKGFQGDKLSQTKERIEVTMDTIISAYRKQLDNLYLPDTLDVDTDIDVLETMLKRDGLSVSDFEQVTQEGTPGTMN